MKIKEVTIGILLKIMNNIGVSNLELFYEVDPITLGGHKYLAYIKVGTGHLVYYADISNPGANDKTWIETNFTKIYDYRD